MKKKSKKNRKEKRAEKRREEAKDKKARVVVGKEFRVEVIVVRLSRS